MPLSPNILCGQAFYLHKNACYTFLNETELENSSGFQLVYHDLSALMVTLKTLLLSVIINIYLSLPTLCLRQMQSCFRCRVSEHILMHVFFFFFK